MKVSYARLATGRQTERHCSRDESRDLGRSRSNFRFASDRKQEKFDKRCTRLALSSC